MSPFLKLLASVSSLAIVSSNFFVTKVAKAMEADQNKDNVPIVRVSATTQEQGHDELSQLVNALVDAQKDTPEKNTLQVAQALPQSSDLPNQKPDSAPPGSPPSFSGPGQTPDANSFGGDAS